MNDISLKRQFFAPAKVKCKKQKAKMSSQSNISQNSAQLDMHRDVDNGGVIHSQRSTESETSQSDSSEYSNAGKNIPDVTPSHIVGRFDVLKGYLEEKIGHWIGNEKLEAMGVASKQLGQREIDAAVEEDLRAERLDPHNQIVLSGYEL